MWGIRNGNSSNWTLKERLKLQNCYFFLALVIALENKSVILLNFLC